MKRILSAFLISLFLIGQVQAATGWVKTKPAGTTSPSDLDTNIGENNAAIDLLNSNFVRGCQLSYSSTSALTVELGEVVVSNSAGTVRLMLANTSNTSVTFSDIDTGAEAASTTYYVYAIASATTDTTFTVKISTSSTAPTGVTYYKKLGSFYNDASSNITNIVNDNFGVQSYDSGWFAVSASTTYSKIHSLGTTKVLVKVYIAENSDGSGWCFDMAGQNNDQRQANMVTLSTTVIQLRTDVTLISAMNAAGASINPSSGYMRVIMIVLE